MRVDEEIREALGENRFTLPPEHVAHRRMRDLLRDNDENNPDEFEEEILWDHEQLEELGLVTFAGLKTLSSVAGNKPAWFLFAKNYSEGEDLPPDDNNQVEHDPYHEFTDDIHEFKLIQSKLARYREMGVVAENDLGEQIDDDGTEALAWYIPFHESSEHWGIYIRESSPRLIANAFLGHFDPVKAHEVATDVLFEHEYFHHISELACTTLENVDPSSNLYRRYSNSMCSGSDYMLEEALANAFSMARVKGRRTRKEIRAFFDSMPPPYCDHWDYHVDVKRARGLRILASMYAGNPYSKKNRYTFGHGLFHHPPSTLKQMLVPLYWTREKSPPFPALPMCIFDEIDVPDDIKKKANHKRTPPSVRKQFWKCIDRLRGSRIRGHYRFEKTQRKDWFKYDVTKDWRMVLEQKSLGKWVVRYLNNWSSYMRYRAKNGL